MAVTFGITRQHQSFDSSTFTEYCTATLSGTWVTGGFSWNPFSVFAGKGSSPLPSTNILDVTFKSPMGYTYATSISGNTATTIIFNGTTQLASGVAVPDATVQVIISKRKM